MKLTSVMLADYATIREGLLHVLGGGITRLIRDPLPASMGAVVAMMLQPEDLDDLQASHTLEVFVTGSGDEGVRAVAKAVMTLPGTTTAGALLPTLPVVVPIQSIPLTMTGMHQITVALDGTVVGTLEYEVLKAVPPPDEQAASASGQVAVDPALP
ncbi:MAG TPA: hypothetical protein VN840_05150 [Streptosporangiaceae bacterium]|nr:hypothetical protein [Streptosporangiaceae bacterium]